MIASAIIGGVASLGSAIYSTVKSAQENKAYEDMINQQRKDNKAWYNLEMAKDYTQRADNQAVFTKQRQLLAEHYRQAAARNVVAGGTDASLALQQEAANKAMAETMSNVAANASNYKDQVAAEYRNKDAALNQQQAERHQQRAAATAQAGSQAVNAGLNFMGNGMANKGEGQASVNDFLSSPNRITEMPKIKA